MDPMLIFWFVFSFLVGFSAVVTPGPAAAAVVSESARRGFIVGPLVVTGHVLLELAMVLLLAAGLAAGLNNPFVMTVLALLGGALLIWIGLSLAWGGYKGTLRLPDPDSRVRGLSSLQLLGVGMGATLANPFWWAWWLTAGAGYLALVARGVPGAAGLAAFFLGHVTGDYLWDRIHSGETGRGQRWISDGAYKRLIIAAGAYLVILGAAFVTSSL